MSDLNTPFKKALGIPAWADRVRVALKKIDTQRQSLRPIGKKTEPIELKDRKEDVLIGKSVREDTTGGRKQAAPLYSNSPGPGPS